MLQQPHRKTHVATTERGRALRTDVQISDMPWGAQARYRGVRTCDCIHGPRKEDVRLYMRVRVGNISRKEQCGEGRGGQSHSRCPVNSLLPRSCVPKTQNKRTDERTAFTRHLLNSCPAAYLSIAGVGPILLKPRDNVTEGERRENVTQAVRRSPVTRPPSRRVASR